MVAARTGILDSGSTGSVAPPVQALQWGLLAGVAFVALAPAIVLADRLTLRRRLAKDAGRS